MERDHETTIEIVCLDKHGNLCEPEKAFRTITKTYDKEGNILQTYMTIDPGRG